jgi:hypothetical protein
MDRVLPPRKDEPSRSCCLGPKLSADIVERISAALVPLGYRTEPKRPERPADMVRPVRGSANLDDKPISLITRSLSKTWTPGYLDLYRLRRTSRGYEEHRHLQLMPCHPSGLSVRPQETLSLRQYRSLLHSLPHLQPRPTRIGERPADSKALSHPEQPAPIPRTPERHLSS